MLTILFLVLHFNFLFIPCGRLSWLPVSFLLHVKYTHYRIVRSETAEPTSMKLGIHSMGEWVWGHNF